MFLGCKHTRYLCWPFPSAGCQLLVRGGVWSKAGHSVGSAVPLMQLNRAAFQQQMVPWPRATLTTSRPFPGMEEAPTAPRALVCPSWWLLAGQKWAVLITNETDSESVFWKESTKPQSHAVYSLTEISPFKNIPGYCLCLPSLCSSSISEISKHRLSLKAICLPTILSGFSFLDGWNRK